jgi:mannose-6-phosphate isomerase class I
VPLADHKLQIIGSLTGKVLIRGGNESLSLSPGQFGLVPAGLEQAVLRAETRASFLRIEAGTE